MIYSIWEGDIIGLSLQSGPGPHCSADGRILDANAIKIKEFEAASWEEACQTMHNHYGWTPYKPNVSRHI